MIHALLTNRFIKRQHLKTLINIQSILKWKNSLNGERCITL